MNTVKDYSMCLRDAVENFTKELINGVFDEHYQLIHIENTKQKFPFLLQRTMTIAIANIFLLLLVLYQYLAEN